MFRVNSIKFHNFRNILDSEVILNQNGFNTPLGGSIIGVYGANGSSKSSIGYALSFLTKLICGFSLAFFHDFSNDFGIYDDVMKLEYDFEYCVNEKFTGLIISFEFKKNEEDKIFITKEEIKIKNSKGRPLVYSLERTDNFLYSSFSENELAKLCDLFSCQPSTIFGLYTSCIQNMSSFFLSCKDLQLIKQSINQNNTLPSEQFKYLINFIEKYLSSTSFIMPDSYGLSITNNLFAIMSGDAEQTVFIAKHPNESFVYSEKNIERIENIIRTSNRFMKKILKDFEVVLDKKESENDKDGNKQYKVKLITQKAKGCFSFENESEGIKRLFLISSAIAKVMNEEDFILFVDEFDEGIFEVLFGDIINSVNDQCMGQFIFTSHNLRPLEMLDYTHFIFSTTNKLNRFVTFKGVKPKNNLRDIYIKKIMYGDENDLSYLIDGKDILEGLIHG